MWGINDQEQQWIVLKIRQHAQDPTRTTARTCFEGGHVSTLNTALAQLLRIIFQCGGRPDRSSSLAILEERSYGEACAVCDQFPSTCTAERTTSRDPGDFGQGEEDPLSFASADRIEEEAAAAEVFSGRGNQQRENATVPPYYMHHPLISLNRSGRSSMLGAWSDYIGSLVMSINPGPSPFPVPEQSSSGSTSLPHKTSSPLPLNSILAIQN